MIACVGNACHGRKINRAEIVLVQFLEVEHVSTPLQNKTIKI